MFQLPIGSSGLQINHGDAASFLVPSHAVCPFPGIGSFVNSELERHGQEFSGQGRPGILSKQEVFDELNSVFRSVVPTALPVTAAQ